MEKNESFFFLLLLFGATQTLAVHSHNFKDVFILRMCSSGFCNECFITFISLFFNALGCGEYINSQVSPEYKFTVYFWHLWCLHSAQWTQTNSRAWESDCIDRRHEGKTVIVAVYRHQRQKKGCRFTADMEATARRTFCST